MIFSQEEFDLRIKKVKDSMSKLGIDILISTDPSNMNYLTGYDGWSFYVPQGVIVSADENQPFWFGWGLKFGVDKHALQDFTKSHVCSEKSAFLEKRIFGLI